MTTPTITVPTPTMGTEHDRVAQHLADAAWKLRNGYTAGGSTVVGSVARLCDDAARAIDPHVRTTYEGRYPAAFDGVEVDDITELTYEQRLALPARFHLPVFMDLTTPTMWICKVCWDDDLYTAWPCAPAQHGGVEVARAAGLEHTR